MSNEEQVKFDYLDSKLFIDGNYIGSENTEIHSQLNRGGIKQVLASKFGRGDRDYILATEWLKTKKCKYATKKEILL